MGWQTVTHSCGHTVDHQLYGKHVDRDNRAHWLATQDCKDCWMAQKQKEKELKNEMAKKENEKLELPKLMGSDKQIAWAETIRNPIIKAALKSKLEYKKEEERTADQINAQNEIVRIWENYKSKLIAEKSAKWWIENRDFYSVEGERLYHNGTYIIRWVAKKAIADGIAPLTENYIKNQENK